VTTAPASAPADRIIDVRVIPRARHDEIAGERNGRMLIRTTAPPVDSKANEAVRRLLAGHLGVPPSAIELIRGATSRDKTFRVTMAR
jgi:uncharacterized protein YggU (UPF0235/DUF167 family)